MKETLEVPTRPVDALGKRTFAIALADTLYLTTFSSDGSQYEVQPLCKIPRTAPLTHVSVVDPNTYTLAASDKSGSVYHIQGNRLVGVALSQDNPNPIVDMFGREPSMITFGRQSGHVTQVDLRAQRAHEFETGYRLSSLALHTKYPFLAAGADRFVKIFDLRYPRNPVAVQTYSSSITSLAWHTREASVFFAAVGGAEPTLTVNSTQKTSSPLASLKTYGLVRSILCAHSQSCLAILREHKEGRWFAMLNWNPQNASQITCNGICDAISECSSPSSGAIEIEDNGVLAAFPSTERFVHCQVLKPRKEKCEPLPQNPFCVR
jgi:WD40 repeat protein